MILDRLENYSLYKGLVPGIDEALYYLYKNSHSALKNGRYDIVGEEVYATVNSYSTKDEKNLNFEAHRNYIDVQYIDKGREYIYWAPTLSLHPVGEYSQEKDVVFLDGESNARFQLFPTYFAVFFPEDAHKPGCHLDSPREVHKVVVKVRLQA